MGYSGASQSVSKGLHEYRQGLLSQPIPPRLTDQPKIETRSHGLINVLYDKVIPQLGLTTGMEELNTRRKSSIAYEASSDVLQFTEFLEHMDLDGARELLVNRRLSGLPLAAINLNLLAPAARHMGLLWERDEWNFNAVTLGVANIQRLMRDLAKLATDELEHQGHHHRALLAPVEGEDHTFGLSMLGDFFGRDGWDVWGGPGTKQEQLLALAESQSFDIAGLSISDERWLDNAEATIVGLRRVSKNPDVKILIGGPLLILHPELADQLGADATATNAPEAIQVAATLTNIDYQAIRA